MNAHCCYNLPCSWDTPLGSLNGRIFITCPNQATLLDQHWQRDIRLWQLIAELSAHSSASYLMTAQGGRWYLDDEVTRDMLNNTCMMCGQFFVSNWQFLRHLFNEHSFHQMDTEHCCLLLVFLTESSPCTYCGSISHAQSPGKRCIALYNLAVFLCSGYGLLRRRPDGHGSSCGDLETHPASERPGSASGNQIGTDRGRSKKHKTKRPKVIGKAPSLLSYQR